MAIVHLSYSEDLAPAVTRLCLFEYITRVIELAIVHLSYSEDLAPALFEYIIHMLQHCYSTSLKQ